jgi:hypothetical protein
MRIEDGPRHEREVYGHQPALLTESSPCAPRRARFPLCYGD